MGAHACCIYIVTLLKLLCQQLWHVVLTTQQNALDSQMKRASHTQPFILICLKQLSGWAPLIPYTVNTLPSDISELLLTKILFHLCYPGPSRGLPRFLRSVCFLSCSS